MNKKIADNVFELFDGDHEELRNVFIFLASIYLQTKSKEYTFFHTRVLSTPIYRLILKFSDNSGLVWYQPTDDSEQDFFTKDNIYWASSRPVRIWDMDLKHFKYPEINNVK